MTTPDRRADLPAESWAREAACSTYPAALFVDEHDPETAKSICSRCPVIQECLGWALFGEVDDDIWGGRTPRERRRLSLAFVSTPAAAPPLVSRPVPTVGARSASSRQRATPRVKRRVPTEPATAATSDGQRTAARCGTESGYRRHLRHGEDVCADCRQAVRAANDIRRRSTGATAPKAQAQCGTSSGYKRHLRLNEKACEACTTANTFAIQQYRARVS